MLIVLPFLLFSFSLFSSLRIEMDSDHQSLKAPMKLLVAVASDNDELTQLAKIIQDNLQRSGQFIVTLDIQEHPKTKAEIKKIFSSGYSLVTFLNHTDNNKAFEWRLYDAAEAHMVKGKKTPKSASLRSQANVLSDELWYALTHQPSSFSSKIAYTKRLTGSHRHQSSICLCNIDGSDNQTFIATPGSYVGLYWHTDGIGPLLFCSEFTRFNVRLISFTPSAQKKIVLDLNGTCVGISLSADTSKAIYCRSGDIWLYAYDTVTKKGTHKCLIKNDGKNVSPTLLPNGDIIFCSDSRQLSPKSKGPHIYLYSASKDTTEPLTKDGFCVGPAYCPRTQKLAYSKRVNGTMQIYVYDMKTKQHSQLTTDKSDKLDCCWSPCGTYLAFCYQQNRTSRIATMHATLKKRFYITPENEYCSCPAWSSASPT